MGDVTRRAVLRWLVGAPLVGPAVLRAARAGAPHGPRVLYVMPSRMRFHWSDLVVPTVAAASDAAEPGRGDTILVRPETDA